MKVQLAYPFIDEAGKVHDPDSMIDLPDDQATQLIRDGRARTPETRSSAKKEA